MAIIACLLWSTAFAGIKIGLKYTTPLQFAGIRFFLSGLYILPFAGSFKTIRTTVSKNYKSMMLLGFVQTFLLYLFFYTGINKVAGSLAAVIIGAQPVFIAIMAHFAFANDKLTSRKIFSFLLGLSGIAIITIFKDNTSDFSGKIAGVTILLLSNLASAGGNIMVKKNKGNVPPLILNSFQLLFGGFLLMLVSIPTEGLHFEPKPYEYYISLGWLSLMSAIAFSIWFTLLKRNTVKVSVLNVWKFIIPVMGAILSWIFLANDFPNLATVLGILIVAASILLMYSKEILVWRSK